MASYGPASDRALSGIFAPFKRFPTPVASGLAPAESSGFFPIGEYAFLSSCREMALIAPSGSVEWMCLPEPDSASVFGAILDRAAGYFRLGPVGRMVPAGRRYVPG